jgi:hypothetical protein
MLAKAALVGGLAVLVVSCGSSGAPPDGSPSDLGAPPDLAADAPADVAPDAGPDVVDVAPDVAADAAVDAPAADGSADGGDAAADAGMCASPYGPFPGCAPPANRTTCDPVCQSGCACGERCKLASGMPTCSAEGPSFVAQYDSCDPKDDRCSPGTICLQESPDHPACGAHCYRHCRSDADCGSNAKCTIEVQFGNSLTTSKVCSPPADACNPFGPARCSLSTARPYPTFGCYVMSATYPDTAICDCAGTTPVGQACTYEHECEPGAECVLFGTARLCRKVCKVGLPAGSPVAVGGCPLAAPTCTPFPGSSQFGYCH